MARTSTFKMRWAHAPGARTHLALRALALRLPLFVFLTLLSLVFSDALTLSGVLWLAFLCSIIQAVAATVASIIVLPANSMLLTLLNAYSASIPERVREAVAPAHSQLSAAAEAAGRARLSLLAEGDRGGLAATGIELHTADGATLRGLLLGITPGGPDAASCRNLRRLRAAHNAAWDGEVVATESGVASPVRGTGGPPSATPLLGVLLYLNGNAEHASLRGDFASSWCPRGYGVMLMDYRGCGMSSARPLWHLGGGVTREGLVTDAIAALSYLTAPPSQGGCGIPRRAIIVVGHSLGGSIAAEAVSLYPGVGIVHDRSFGRLSTIAISHVTPWAWASVKEDVAALERIEAAARGAGQVLGGTSLPTPNTSPPPPPDTLPLHISAARWCVRVLLRHIACWELDAVAAWRALPESAGVICFHEDDAIIPFAGSLFPVLVAEGFWGVSVLRMEGAGAGRRGNGGLIAHNRAWTPREEEQTRKP